MSDATDVVLPPGAGDALKSLGAEHGLAGIFILVLLTATTTLFWLMIKRDQAAAAKLTEERAGWDAKHTALQERRIIEGRENLTVMGAATSSIVELKRAVEDRTASSALLSENLKELVLTTKANREFLAA